MNIATILKEEITRLARKEVKTEIEQLKKTSARYRSDIAALKRQITDIERLVAKLGKGGTKSPAIESPEGDIKIRYSAKSLASQRKRLGLTAEELGRLLNVSGQTIYNWEAEKARPRESQMPAIAAVRQLGKKEASLILANIS